jgi:putative membrane protein
MLNRLVTKIGLVCLMFLGLAVTAGLVIANNSAAVWQSLAAVGWGVAAVVLVRAAMIAINGLAWGLLLAKLAGAATSVFVLLRWLRESVNVMLPVASVGGEIVAARVLTFWRVPISLAVAGVLADILLQTFAQAMFTLLGAVLLMGFVGLGILPWFLIGTAVALIALGGFYLVQRRGGLRVIDGAIARISRRLASRSRVTVLHLHATMNKVWGNRSGVIAAVLVHLAAWMIGTFEVWIALYFMGHAVPLYQAMIIESLGAAISSAAFIIPGSWGVQESGYILVGHLLGVPAQSALALSLVKRVPDIVLGVPGLLVWQLLEARRAVTRGSQRSG